MIKQMVIRELYDAETGDYTSRRVDADELEFFFNLDVSEMSESIFFDHACDYLWQYEDLDVDEAKIDTYWSSGTTEKTG